MDTLATAAPAIELTTFVKFDQDAHSRDDLVASLESAIVREAENEGIVTLKQYFVRSVGRDVQIGLRFVDLPADRVEDTASDLLEGAIRRVQSAGESGSVPARRTSTVLLGV